MRSALIQWLSRLLAMLFVALGVSAEKADEPAIMIATGLIAGLALAIDAWLSHRLRVKQAKDTQATQENIVRALRLIGTPEADPEIKKQVMEMTKVK